MSIEIQFNSVVIEPQDIQENLPNLFSAISSYLPVQKLPKRRTIKRKKKTVSFLIDEIIDSIETK